MQSEREADEDRRVDDDVAPDVEPRPEARRAHRHARDLAVAVVEEPREDQQERPGQRREQDEGQVMIHKRRWNATHAKHAKNELSLRPSAAFAFKTHRTNRYTPTNANTPNSISSA